MGGFGGGSGWHFMKSKGFPNPGFLRTKRIGANPEKSDLVNFRGPD